MLPAAGEEGRCPQHGHRCLILTTCVPSKGMHNQQESTGMLRAPLHPVRPSFVELPRFHWPADICHFLPFPGPRAGALGHRGPVASRQAPGQQLRALLRPRPRPSVPAPHCPEQVPLSRACPPGLGPKCSDGPLLASPLPVCFKGVTRKGPAVGTAVVCAGICLHSTLNVQNRRCLQAADAPDSSA